jgi:gas vesicle protein
MKFVISTTALLVLGSIIGSLAGLLFWPDLSYATGAASRANLFLHTHHHHRRMG